MGGLFDEMSGTRAGCTAPFVHGHVPVSGGMERVHRWFLLLSGTPQPAPANSGSRRKPEPVCVGQRGSHAMPYPRCSRLQLAHPREVSVR